MSLIDLAKQSAADTGPKPYGVIVSRQEQHILNAPVLKPLLIFVLAGVKRLGREGDIVCPQGHFLFLSNAPTIDMRNVPDGEYVALLIEFEYSDFDPFQDWTRGARRPYVQGRVGPSLAQAVAQFIDLPRFAPPELWPCRRQELLRLMYLLGHVQIGEIVERPSLSHRVHDIVAADVQSAWSLNRLADRLALSEPTLRRKLKAEGVGIKEIIHRAKLGHGLNLVQTSETPIGLIAEACGFSSQSRFTIKFKELFGVTPTELRKTRFHD